MLSRAGGAAHYQKIVNTLADLPSPLDAEPGSKIIVRETEEVYGLNFNTRMWEPIGTIKKVGGKKPEDIAQHIDSGGNPHGTKLDEVLTSGAEAQVSKEISLGRKSTGDQIQLLSDGSAIRIGSPTKDKKDGTIWINTGKGSRDVLRVVDDTGADKLVILADGSVVATGAASFAGGIKGDSSFEDKITAAEGVFSAKGYDLLLSGDKSVVVRSGDKDQLVVTDNGIGIGISSPKHSIDTAGDLSIGGVVQSNLIPGSKLSLGQQKAPWDTVHAGSLEVAPSSDRSAISVNLPPNSSKPAVSIASPVPGDRVCITQHGELGLGTDKPARRLDVGGTGLVVGTQTARLALDDSGLTYNKAPDGKPQDSASSTWVVNPGVHDTFSVSRNGQALLRVSGSETNIAGSAKVNGDLTVDGKFVTAGLSGPSSQSIGFNKRVAAYSAEAHEFHGPVRIDANVETPLDIKGVLSVNKGDLLGSGSLGSSSKPWNSAVLKDSLTVGPTSYGQNGISCSSEFTIDSQTVVVGPELKFGGPTPKLNINEGARLEGEGGSAIFSTSGSTCGLSFEGNPWSITGAAKVETAEASANYLKVDGTGELAEFSESGRRVATINKTGLVVAGDLRVGGLALKKVEEEVLIDGIRATTSFEIPAGVRVEAVVVRIKNGLDDARFIQVGDSVDPDRFSGPTTDIQAGSIIRGLNHWERGRAVQKTKGPIVLSADAPAKGKALVTVFYFDPASL